MILLILAAAILADVAVCFLVLAIWHRLSDRAFIRRRNQAAARDTELWQACTPADRAWLRAHGWKRSWERIDA